MLIEALLSMGVVVILMEMAWWSSVAYLIWRVRNERNRRTKRDLGSIEGE